MAFIQLYDGAFYYGCGGSIISRRHILTAGHCVAEMESAVIRIGSTSSFSGGRTYTSKWFLTHPKYDPSNVDYDVAIIRVPRGMNLDGIYATKVNLIQSGKIIPEGTILNITGWGATIERGNGTELLRAVQLPTIKIRDCRRKLSEVDIGVTSRMFCAGFEKGGKDSCQGDSGGPAVNNDIQVGIVSLGYGCARLNRPGVYTNLAHPMIRWWIKWNTGV